MYSRKQEIEDRKVMIKADRTHLKEAAGAGSRRRMQEAAEAVKYSEARLRKLRG